jgi:hypothetical protein
MSQLDPDLSQLLLNLTHKLTLTCILPLDILTFYPHFPRWSPKERPNSILPCVIYMHGNSSARLEAIPQLATVLSLGVCLVSFDFAGSGLSGGEHVSLGAFEKEDLKAVVEHLREEGLTSTIALWGRSIWGLPRGFSIAST